MKVNENTEVMLRLHKQPNNRGLQIYNPYFEEVGLNAIYLLSHSENAKQLLDGIRNLNYTGGIAAGFEKDPGFAKELDELSEVSEKLGRVGIVINSKGKLRGHYQGGEGLYQSITSKYGKLADKNIVILGSGGVAKALMLEIQKQNDIPSITLVNRNLENAEKLASEFNFISKTHNIDDLTEQKGDVFINATYIGSPWNQGENYEFTEDFIKNFQFVADVTFVPIEPQLIAVAKKVGIDYAPGHRMFMYQAKVCLENILNHQMNLEVFEKYMLQDFKVNWS